MAAALLVSPAFSTAAHAAAPLCTNDPTTLAGTNYTLASKTTEAEGIFIELRYNSPNRCAWARIKNPNYFTSYDGYVWVDWASTYAQTSSGWEGPLSWTYWGGHDAVWTAAYNDANHYMRACALVNGGGVSCTGWA